MRFSLHPGVWTTAFGLTSTGACGVVASAAWSIPWLFSLASIGVGVGVFIWGLKINDRHWWAGLSLRRQTRSIVPPPAAVVHRWVSLDWAIRYVAKRSQWGAVQDPDDPYFLIKLGNLLRDALACGDLNARGRYFHVLHGGIKDPPLHPLLPLDREFWEKTRIDPYWSLWGLAQNIGGRPGTNAVRQGDYEGRHDICLDQSQVEALWQPRQSAFEDPKIPFANVRDLASEYGFNLDHRHPDSSNLAYEIEGELKEAAANCRLPVWGRPYNGRIRDHDPMVPIPPKHFLEFSFRHGALEYAVKNDQTCTTTIALLLQNKPGEKGKTFYDLHLSTAATRAIIKRLADERAAVVQMPLITSQVKSPSIG